MNCPAAGYIMAGVGGGGGQSQRAWSKKAGVREGRGRGSRQLKRSCFQSAVTSYQFLASVSAFLSQEM